MAARPKLLVITAEMAHQDPRVSWSLDILARSYDVTIASATACRERDSLDFYRRWRVLPCGRMRGEPLLGQARSAVRFLWGMIGLVCDMVRAAVRRPDITWEVVRFVVANRTAPEWFFKPRSALRMHASIWPAVRREKFDVVWCHEFTSLITGLRYRSRWPECQLVWDEHEFGIVPPLPGFQRWAAGQVAAVVAVSDPILDDLTAALPPLRGKGFCVPNVPPRHAAGFRPCGHPVRWVVIGMESAHLVSSLRAFLRIWAEVSSPARCLLDCYIMRNTRRSYVRSTAFDDLRCDGVRFLEPLPHDELADRLAATYDVGLVPYSFSGRYRQACPNKIGEYLSAGLAVVMNADLEWYAERIRRFGCGAVADLHDRAAAAAAIASLSDPDAVDALKRRARAAAYDSWNYEAVVEPVLRRLGPVAGPAPVPSPMTGVAVSGVA